MVDKEGRKRKSQEGGGAWLGRNVVGREIARRFDNLDPHFFECWAMGRGGDEWGLMQSHNLTTCGGEGLGPFSAGENEGRGWSTEGL